MASTNFKLFDENKTNMMSDTEYNINTQRLNGVQAGIASSQLQNKTLYQTSLVAYSLAQIMMQNGYDANDSAAVSAFVGNMSNSLLQKVLDKATSAEAKAGTLTNKWISPATMKAAALLLSGGTMSGPINMGNNKITNLADPTDSLDSANKKYVDESSAFEKVKVVNNRNLNASDSTGSAVECDIPVGYTLSDFLRFKAIGHEVTLRSGNSSDSSLFFPINTTTRDMTHYIRFYGKPIGKTIGILLTANYNFVDSNGLESEYLQSGSSLLLNVNTKQNKLFYYVRSDRGNINFDITTYVYI